jgi:Strictosidine synthase
MAAKVHNSVRFTLLGLVTFYFVVKTWPKAFLPYGPAVPWNSADHKSFAPVDPSNDSLQIKHGRTQRIYERLEEGEGQKKPLLVGPETVFFDKDGTMFVLTEDAKLVRLTDFKDGDDGSTVTAKTTLIKNIGVGRPLSGKFTNDGKTLYIADAILGLLRIDNPITDPQSKVELVASSFRKYKQKAQKLLFVDDVCIGPKSGKVYFTDATTIAPDRIKHEGGAKRSTWDLMYGTLTDLFRGAKSGRLLEYDPKTDTVKLLADSLHFPNGIAVDKDETFLFFAETWSRRLSKYHLTGNKDKKGTLEIVVENDKLVGYPDGTDCSWSKEGPGSGKCYAAIPTSILPFHQLLAKLPDAVDLMLRMIYLLLPRHFAPRINPYGGFMEVDSKTGDFRHIQDPNGKDMVVITGVTEHNGKLYLGSIVNNFIGVYDLAPPPPGDDGASVKAK